MLARHDAVAARRPDAPAGPGRCRRSARVARQLKRLAEVERWPATTSAAEEAHGCRPSASSWGGVGPNRRAHRWRGARYRRSATEERRARERLRARAKSARDRDGTCENARVVGELTAAGRAGHDSLLDGTRSGARGQQAQTKRAADWPPSRPSGRTQSEITGDGTPPRQTITPAGEGRRELRHGRGSDRGNRSSALTGDGEIARLRAKVEAPTGTRPVVGSGRSGGRADRTETRRPPHALMQATDCRGE
jgi:hypothetical protein